MGNLHFYKVLFGFYLFWFLGGHTCHIAVPSSDRYMVGEHVIRQVAGFLSFIPHLSNHAMATTTKYCVYKIVCIFIKFLNKSF